MKRKQSDAELIGHVDGRGAAGLEDDIEHQERQLDPSLLVDRHS